MFRLKGKRVEDGIEYGKFSIICSSINTGIRPGDCLLFLNIKEAQNLFLDKKFGDSGTIRAEIVSDKDDNLFKGMRFTKKEAQLIVVILAASFGLSFKEKKKLDSGSILFEFLQ